MKIRKFEDLTQFVSDEYTKMIDTYSVQKPSDKFMTFIEDTLVKYTKLYDKPLFRLQKKEVKQMYSLEKKELELEKALATMPHGKLWKFFHSSLWAKMKYRVEELNEEDKKKSTKPKKAKKNTNTNTSLPAVVVNPMSPPVPPEDTVIE